MTELATEEACDALRNTIAPDQRIRWAREDLANHGISATVVSLPEVMPTQDDPRGHALIAVSTPDGVEVSPQGTHFSDPPGFELSWDDAASLLSQLARLVSDHQAEQAAARAKRIREYAELLHTNPDVCFMSGDTDPCDSCTRTATWVIDNPPPAV